MALRGLYAITDSGLLPDERLVEAVGQAIAGGATVIQYRDKRTDGQHRHTQARALQGLCRRHGVPLIINDDIELAATVGAAGVHLGKDDAAMAEARARLGADAIIGVSCYNRLDLATAAVAAGADYVAFGRFFSSTIKPDAVQAAPHLLAAARTQFDVPVCAIGGITADNGGTLIEQGADLLAVINGVFGQQDVRAAAGALAALFE